MGPVWTLFGVPFLQGLFGPLCVVFVVFLICNGPIWVSFDFRPHGPYFGPRCRPFFLLWRRGSYWYSMNLLQGCLFHVNDDSSHMVMLPRRHFDEHPADHDLNSSGLHSVSLRPPRPTRPRKMSPRVSKWVPGPQKTKKPKKKS